MAQENSGPVFRKPPGAKVKFVQDSATEFKTTHLHKTRLLTFDLTFIVFSVILILRRLQNTNKSNFRIKFVLFYADTTTSVIDDINIT